MRTIVFFLILATGFLVFNCKKEDYSLRFKLLTSPTWSSDSLLANDVDASGPGQLLEKFKGDAKFNTDGSGYFGKFKGSWILGKNDTEITIYSDSLPIPSLTTSIVELNDSSLKITTGFPNFINPSENYRIRMTFKAK